MQPASIHHTPMPCPKGTMALYNAEYSSLRTSYPLATGAPKLHSLLPTKSGNVKSTTRLAFRASPSFLHRGDNGVAARLAFIDLQASCLGHNNTISNPSFPSTCPYVTSVGGTYITPGKTVNDPEEAVIMGANSSSPGTSGGGFYNIFAIPDYQKEATNTYFADHYPGYDYYSGLVADANNPTRPNATALAGSTGGR